MPAKPHSCRIGLLRTLLLLFGPALAARADDLAITWDPSPDPTIVGYALYYAQTGCPDFTRVDLGNTTTATVSGLDGSQTYVLYTVGIYDSGQESPPSNFLTYPVPVQLIVNGSFESGYDGWTASGNQLLVQDRSSSAEMLIGCQRRLEFD